MPTLITGIGTAVPPHRISQSDASEIAQQYACETADQQRRFHAMYHRTGVKTRHSVLLDASEGELGGRQSFFTPAAPTTLQRMQRYEAEAGSLALSAAAAALQDAGVAPGRFSHVVTVSCTGFHAPGFDIALIKHLDLPRDIARTHVGFMGCHGFLSGLRVVKAFLDADPSACALLCAVELCSLHLQYGWDPGKIIANALFADGAGAVVGVGRGAPESAVFQVLATGSTLIADTEDAMSWRIGDQGFEMRLSVQIPELIGRHVRPWLDGWLAEHGLSVATVGSWAVHPGGPRILSAFGESTGLEPSALETSSQVLTEYGNMSSPTVLFILDRLRRASAPRPWVALAFGPGLTVEAALLA